jgi:hypothetical protein
MTFQTKTITVPVFAPKPITAEPVPQNPSLAPNGRSNMHNDAYMSDTYNWAGPVGGTLSVGFKMLLGECACLTFDSTGRIVTVSSGKSEGSEGTSRTLLVLDPDSLDILASMNLPSGGGGSTGFGGGGYICLNDKDQAIIPTANQQLWIVDVLPGAEGLSLSRFYDLSGSISDVSASVQSTVPDWSGRLWWVTDTGVVGYTDPASGMSWTIKLPSPQQIGNSFAVDETGGVFIASNYAMYRFDIDATGQNPKITWSYSYDRGTREKPGQQNFGTGTTPTLVGKGFCGITDNADPQMHVIVYRREKDFINNRIVCQIPVFPPGYSDTENSLIGYTGNFIVENNYGYNASVTHQTTRVVPGVARVRYDNQPCPGETVWASNQVVVPSVVSKLSLATGLIYTYTLEIEKGGHIWSITAIDAETGSVAFSVQAGSGKVFDNHYSSVFISPNGTLYVPTVLGIVSLHTV